VGRNRFTPDTYKREAVTRALVYDAPQFSRKCDPGVAALVSGGNAAIHPRFRAWQLIARHDLVDCVTIEKAMQLWVDGQPKEAPKRDCGTRAQGTRG
jgi:hypothetical protein